MNADAKDQAGARDRGRRRRHAAPPGQLSVHVNLGGQLSVHANLGFWPFETLNPKPEDLNPKPET